MFAQAGAAYDDDFDSESAHARLTTSFRFGNVDMRRYLDFWMLRQDEFSEVMQRAADAGHQAARPSHAVRLGGAVPHTEDGRLLGARRRRSHRRRVRVARHGARRAAFFREHVPGFERAWILDTASQIGTRHARRLVGVERITIEHWMADGSYADSIGLCPGMTPSFPTLEIPYRSMVPERLDGLLAAGRNLSADTRSHAALREIPECWAMGEAAGVAAVQALADGVALRDVDIAAVQAQLARQGAVVERRKRGSEPRPARPGASTTSSPSRSTESSMATWAPCERRLCARSYSPRGRTRNSLGSMGPVTAENEPRERRRGRTREASTRASALPEQRPFAQPRLRLPPTELLSADQIETIHQASLRILRDLGMRVLDPETRAIYDDAGATVREQQVTFDPAMVETLIKTAPAEFTLHSWNPAHSLHIGGDWLAFGTVGSAPNSFDLDRGRRTGNRADYPELLPPGAVAREHPLHRRLSRSSRSTSTPRSATSTPASTCSR